MRERKRIARLLLADITLARTDDITVHIRLRGGQDHTLTLPLPLASWQIRQTPAEVVSQIDTLLEEHTDSQIADLLTQQGLTSGTGQPLHARLVRQIREAYQLRSHTQHLRDQGLLSLNARLVYRTGEKSFGSTLPDCTTSPSEEGKERTTAAHTEVAVQEPVKHCRSEETAGETGRLLTAVLGRTATPPHWLRVEWRDADHDLGGHGRRDRRHVDRRRRSRNRAVATVSSAVHR
jgi:hypothetical protein